jgi:hypothetical protein
MKYLNKGMLHMFKDLDQTLTSVKFSFNVRKVADQVVEELLKKIPGGWQFAQEKTIEVLEKERMNMQARYNAACKSTSVYKKINKNIDRHIKSAKKQIKIADSFEASALKNCQVVTGTWNKMKSKVSLTSLRCKLALLNLINLYRHQFPLFSLRVKLKMDLEQLEDQANGKKVTKHLKKWPGKYTFIGMHDQFMYTTNKVKVKIEGLKTTSAS